MILMESEVNAMRIKIKYCLILLLLALIAFTFAQAVVNPDDSQTQIISSGLPLPFESCSDTDIPPEGLSFAKTASLKASSFTLPASLQVIEDSAFEGTAIVSVGISESVSYIGERAFANIPTLLGVSIPDKTQFIGKEAFADSKQVTLTASSNSYARTWAKDNGYRFRLLATFSARDGMILYSFQNGQSIRSSRRESTETADNHMATNIRERRTGRTVGELKASRYKGVAALHIQSRYFP